MKEVIKKFLTDKAARNATTLTAFVGTVASVRAPWLDLA